MYKHAHFYTFSYNLIIDPKSINQAVYFDYKKQRVKLNIPYKTYPYNHDFTYKPIFYKNSKGTKINLPITKGVCPYPVYDENLVFIGTYIQANEVFSLKGASFMRLSNDATDKHFKYSPVDTLRFETVSKFSFDTPKFISDFIGQLRNLSGQFWLGKPILMTEGVTIEGKIKTNGILDNFQIHSNLINVVRYNKGIPVNLQIWKEAIENVVNENKLDFSKSLFLDAIYEFANNNKRAVVLNLANSIDIKINQLFKSLQLKLDSDDEFDRAIFVRNHRPHKKVSSTYIPGLISEFLKHILNVDYSLVCPEYFEFIKTFWLEKRNIVAHGGDIELDDSEATNILDASENLLLWLNEIKDEINESL
ncbi:hypothetical protein [Ancylomarina sp.]|uniref:hypothetical protein n=1 Tax=Ancylomarina sp. TaxID=1970196 RepID=UPI0035654671